MKSILTALLLAFATPLFANGEAVILKTGTLADFDRSSTLVYAQDITLAQDQTLAEREIGEVILSADPKDDGNVMLAFHKDDGKRALGRFPQSVGNPLFMYFVEAVIRDMAGFTGGSPFYIRNRVKNALVNGTEITDGTIIHNGQNIDATIAVMRPFENDPNRERMQGFQDLTLAATLSEAVTGWYVSLEATAATDDTVVYQRRLEVQP